MKGAAPYGPMPVEGLNLSLLDVSLGECALRRLQGPDDAELQVLFKKSMHHRRFADESGESLLCMAVLGMRWAAKIDDKLVPVIEITADFLVECKITGPVTDQQLSSFCEGGATRIVWPFWRQHVADMISRANLPEFVVPIWAPTITTNQKRIQKSQTLRQEQEK